MAPAAAPTSRSVETMTDTEIDALREPRRLAALHGTDLLDTAPEESFDRFTRLASRMLGAPVSLVSLVDRDRQFFKSSIGLPRPWASRRETPLSHSFCQHAVRSGEPLVVDDARDHPLLRDNPAILDLGVVAYLGTPLVTSDGQALGAFCVIDSAPRRWTAEQLELVKDLAAAVMTEIELRAAIRDADRERRENSVLLDSVAEGIYGLDHEGRCTFLNRAGAALLGYRPDEVLGRSMHELVHHSRPDGSPYPADECPISRAFWAGEAARADDEVLWRKDGTPLSVEYACRPLADDAGRRGAVVTFADVGERARMERALRLSEARFRMMFEQSPISTQVFAPDGTSLYANPAWERLWGVTHAQIAGYNVLRDPQLVELGAAPSIERGFAGEYAEVPAIRYQPERTIGGITEVPYRWVRARTFPVRDEAGAIREVVLMHEDVTDARRAEEERAELLANERAARAEAEAAVRARDEFLSIASHELRTPVAGVKGYAQSLRRARATGRLDDARLERSLRAIEASADRLAVLTSDLLDVSRIRTGQLPFNPRPTDLAALAREVAGHFEDRLDATHRLDVRAGEAPCPVLADADRIDQVLTNLIENAAKYSPNGGTIEVAVATDGGDAVVTVRDPGIGLPPGSAEAIFEPFGRAPNAAGHHIPGMGLGLYICRTIVERHGGSIRAESAGEGQGTTVSFRLPLDATSADAAYTR